MTFENAKGFADHVQALEAEYAAEPDDLETRRAALKDLYAHQIAESGFNIVRVRKV
jgi:hypothetical protein